MSGNGEDDRPGGHVAGIDNDQDDGAVDVVVPLRTEFAATLRVVAASLAADADFTVDEIDDLRLAISEVFSSLADGAPHGRCRARFRLRSDGLVVTFDLDPVDGRSAVTGDPPDSLTLDDLAATILATVVDEFRTDRSGITLVKRAAETTRGGQPGGR